MINVHTGKREKVGNKREPDNNFGKKASKEIYRSVSAWLIVHT